MAAIVWADVEAIAPDVSTVAVAAQTDILAWVNSALRVTDFGGESSASLKLARVYLAAHLGTITVSGASGGVAGPITSESVGDVSRSYASMFSASTASGLDPGLDSTSFGRSFRMIVRMSLYRLPKVP